jgi:hypothetical protein
MDDQFGSEIGFPTLHNLLDQLTAEIRARYFANAFSLDISVHGEIRAYTIWNAVLEVMNFLPDYRLIEILLTDGAQGFLYLDEEYLLDRSAWDLDNETATVFRAWERVCTTGITSALADATLPHRFLVLEKLVEITRDLVFDNLSVDAILDNDESCIRLFELRSRHVNLQN